MFSLYSTNMKSTSFIGLKILAGISIMSTAILLGGCSWTLKDSLRDLGSQLNASGILQPKPKIIYYEVSSESKGDRRDTYDMALRDLTEVWQKNQPIFIHLSVVAIFIGIIQLLVSFNLLFTDPKTIRNPTRRWLGIHILLAAALTVVLLCTIMIKRNTGRSHASWSQLLEEFHEKLKEKQGNKDFTSLIFRLKSTLPIFYGTIGQNVCLLFFLFFVATRYISRLNCDYELHR